jgi:hypothetical protein
MVELADHLLVMAVPAITVSQMVLVVEEGGGEDIVLMLLLQEEMVAME